MANNTNLSAAKSAKNDEFYTQYGDIETEMNAYFEFNPDVFRDKTILLPCDDPEWSNFTKYFAANFSRFGLKKLISTSYTKSAGSRQLTLFEEMSPLYDAKKHETHGKLFTLTRDKDKDGSIDTDDIEFSGYLEGDGDFRSKEVTKLRDEADIIITNPPFSLFREFLAWILAGEKQFVIIGNMNAITYKEVFPLIKENKIWTGCKPFTGGMDMIQPRETFDATKTKSYSINDNGQIIKNIMGVIWFSNIDHGKRHEPLLLDTMEHNLKFNKKLRKKLENDYGKIEYPHYDNYDAIEVPFVEAIPSDYEAAMGVPITFLDKWNPDQFEIVGSDSNLAKPEPLPNGKTGTGRFYIRERERESTALVLALDHSEEEMREALAAAGVPESEMTWRSGIMGVPITFLDKYNPEQFEIIGSFNANNETDEKYGYVNSQYTTTISNGREIQWNGPVVDKKPLYKRLIIRPRKEIGQNRP